MRKLLFVAGMAALAVACSQKQGVVETAMPVSTINVESLKDSLDLNMDITGLQLGDLRVLRNAPAARQGFPFKDAYIRGIYEGTTWYDSLMWDFDGRTDFSSVEEKEGEDWRDYYYRASEETGILKYTPEELDFMKRVKAREEELLKLNFEVEKGLKVNMQNLANPRQFTEFDPQLAGQLARDGFAILPADHEQLFHVYEQNDYQCFPSFVTTDIYLQLYHVYFDCMLREIEEHKLAGLMTDLSKRLYEAMHRQAENAADEEMQQLAHHNAVYFAVAYELLTGKQIADATEQAEAKAEIERVMKSENDRTPFMADYNEISFPYSLFRPRGHYTRNETLQRYFRGMMWLQTVPFGLEDANEVKEAVMVAYALQEDKVAQKNYDVVNLLLTHMMGLPDNLSILQVQQEVRKRGLLQSELLTSAPGMADLTEALNEIGNTQTRIRPKFERTSHNKICLMPQRYQPDAEVLQEMVDYDGDPTERATPQGLDFMAAMGVSAAEKVLIEEGQKWKDFKPMLEKMKKRMGEINWQESLATQWMQTVKTVNEKDKGVPYFMLGDGWDLKNLNAALSSWAELKHDAILYAKQPMGAECGGGGPPDPVVKGYVEPNVTFWKKAIELLDNTANLLNEHDMMTEKVKEATERIGEEVGFLLRISEKELAGKALTDEEYDQIKCIGATFENISLDLLRQPDQYLTGWNDVQGTDRKMALVADVYTANANNNPNKSILYEAVGMGDEIYVVVEIGGYLYLTRGAVFSYREFTEPMDKQRLTDEEWQQELEKNPRKGVPEWMEPIMVPLEQKPEPNEEIFYSSGC
ncbi:MAG: DUF3160 domain-containing protein [Prevotella sp.]|nr:DUF3160 domain-containing protein [Prevotella sp.]